MADDLAGNPFKELIKRFIVTFVLGVVIYRLGAFVPVPGIDIQQIKKIFEGGEGAASILRLANMFNGGTIANGSIFGLGIMPYISASIIIQLLAFSFPALKQLQKEGEVGRRKLNQYTRYTTVAICLVQSLIAAMALSQYDGGKFLREGYDATYFVILAMVVITTGSMVLLWLAEQITKHGIGNGVSVIIMIGILSGFPAAFAELVGQDGGQFDFPKLLMLVLVFLAIIAALVLITQARRFINMEQQRRVQGNRVYGGAQTKLPLMLNQAGVIPVIFASPVMVVLVMAFNNQWVNAGTLVEYDSPLYRYIFASIIIFFTYFYISITVDLNDWANNFKQSGFFIRGVKPGRNTVEYLRFRLLRVTFVGAFSLAFVTVVPSLLGKLMGLSGMVSQIILGGVGLLIVVGVSLDVIQKVGAFLLAHQYQGMMLKRDGGGGAGGGGGGSAAAKTARKRF